MLREPTLDTAAIEARLAAATPDVQIDRYDHGGGRCYVVVNDIRQLVADYYVEGDRELHYHAPADIRALLDEVARRKSVDALIACMASQLTTDEMSEDHLVDGDFESAYDTLVKNSRDIWRAINARKALEGGE